MSLQVSFGPTTCFNREWQQRRGWRSRDPEKKMRNPEISENKRNNQENNGSNRFDPVALSNMNLCQSDYQNTKPSGYRFLTIQTWRWLWVWTTSYNVLLIYLFIYHFQWALPTQCHKHIILQGIISAKIFPRIESIFCS
jgi:hypothetical protein